MFRACGCSLFCSLLIMSTLIARDDDAIATKLTAAKNAYDSELKKFDKSVRDYFDMLESTARRDGNKKSLDQVKSEREVYVASGELPKKIPLSYATRQITMRKSMTEAFKAAVRDYTKNGRDDLASKAEKEMQNFLAPKGKGDSDEPGRIPPGEYVQLDDKNNPRVDLTMTVTRVSPHILEARGNEGWVMYAVYSPEQKLYSGVWEWQSLKSDKIPATKAGIPYNVTFYHNPDLKLYVINGGSRKGDTFQFTFRPKP
jgi:hypothetical protein